MASITVRGRGVTMVAPDEVTVGLTVEALRKSAAEALAEDGEHTNRGWQHRGYRASSRLAVRVDDGELASRLVTRELVAEIDVTFQLEQG